MPFLQSISQDFLAKSLGRRRATILGGEASIDANFLYIDVKNTGSNTLQVFGNTSIPADYVVVGGGGGGGYAGAWDYGRFWYGNPFGACFVNSARNLVTVAYNANTMTSLFAWQEVGLTFYVYLGGWAYQAAHHFVSGDGGGGGGGGVLTGSVTLTSQSYGISVGTGGSGGTRTVAAVKTAPTVGGSTTAFGVTALGGGFGAYDWNFPGGSGSSGGGSASREGGAGTAGQGNPGSHRTPYAVDANGFATGTSVPLGAYSWTPVSTSDSLSWPAFSTYGPNLYTMITYDWVRNQTFFGRNLLQPGWGGGAGAPAMSSETSGGLGPARFALAANSVGGEARSGQNSYPSAYMNTAALSDRSWSPQYDSVRGVNAYNYVETVGATGQQARMSIWNNVRWGIGVDALGLKVGGGGMSGISARDLANHFGGGYIMDATTAQGTYSKNGLANTGGGGGGGIAIHNGSQTTSSASSGGSGGSGIVRIRIKRSDLGI